VDWLIPRPLHASNAHGQNILERTRWTMPNQRGRRLAWTSRDQISLSGSKKESTDLEAMRHDLKRTCSMHRTAEIYNGTRGFFWISVYNTITQSQNQSRSSYKQDLTLCSKTCNIPTNHPYLATTSSHSDRPTEPTDMFPSNPIITQKRVEKEEENENNNNKYRTPL